MLVDKPRSRYCLMLLLLLLQPLPPLNIVSKRRTSRVMAGLRMEMISLQGKTNFFEKRVGEYQKAGVMTGGAPAMFEQLLAAFCFFFGCAGA